MLDDGVRVWFQNVGTCCGNCVAGRGIGTLVGVLTEEKRIRSQPRKEEFEDKVDKTSENTLLRLLFRGYGLRVSDTRPEEYQEYALTGDDFRRHLDFGFSFETVDES